MIAAAQSAPLAGSLLSQLKEAFESWGLQVGALAAHFDTKEIADIEAHAFTAVKDFHYFTYLWVAGKMIEPIHVRDFSARQANGLVTYSFVVPLPEPVDPRAAKVQAELYDETYFVQVDLDKPHPVRFEGTAHGCQGKITKDAKRRYYGGVIVPDQITVACGG